MHIDQIKQVVVITGGGSGIGKEIARAFLKEKATVFILGRSESKLRDTVHELKNVSDSIGYYCADVSHIDSMNSAINKIVETAGKINVLIQNAGIFGFSLIENMNNAQWDEIIHNNLTGSFNAVKACLPYLKKQPSSRIIFISSIAGPKIGLPNLAHYSASKAGLNGFMRTAAIEFARDNITVNSIEPGNILIDTPDQKRLDEIKEEIRAIPVGRIGSPEDIAHLAVFLASPAASFITGQNIVIDGGQTILPDLMDRIM